MIEAYYGIYPLGPRTIPCGSYGSCGLTHIGPLLIPRAKLYGPLIGQDMGPLRVPHGNVSRLAFKAKYGKNTVLFTILDLDSDLDSRTLDSDLDLDSSPRTWTWTRTWPYGLGLGLGLELGGLDYSPAFHQFILQISGSYFSHTHSTVCLLS